MYKLFSFLFLMTQIVLSQSVQPIGNSSGLMTTAQMGMSYYEVPIEGTPYVNELFKKGTTIINGNYKNDGLMRYNAYQDAIEIKNENGSVRTLLRRENIIANIDGTMYMVRNYKSMGQIKAGYFNPLNEGYTRLLLKPKKIFLQAENPENGYDVYKPAKYMDVSLYYIQQGDHPAIEIKLNKKSVLKLLGGNSDNLKKYIKQNDLNLRLQEDIIRLLNYYNTLDNDNTML
ncbi:hypothetical protein SAMN04488009_0866 [Maribacter sedimenticola]|uniref:GLPGLI family protein n=1 Tax=Maribacter sedimenticola TaxID=228956 RepID=A0ABY1SE88_9FLAO|nr:hypothetical protein [Maribacter sedimenticola]SNR28971.1 hypothetical protein SAMN04488009_0866 [Maribacter sedimenticola]